MDIKDAISTIVDRIDLTETQMEGLMRQIMSGDATPIQIGGVLAGLRTKGESVAEITAAARVMREMATRIDIPDQHLVDTCGTGGDGAKLFNVSTAAAFVVAAGGARVAKHGNRSMSSKSGSADVLEALGISIDLEPDQVVDCIDELGIGFLYAPAHHQAARHAAAPRRELGTRTLFNLLGPITNPANAPHQLLGVFAQRWVEPMAKVLAGLGSRHVLVVHSSDGLDEIAVSAPTHVAELHQGQVRTYQLHPEEFGFRLQSTDSMIVDGPDESARMILSVMDGQEGAPRDVVILNAGAALYAADVATSIRAGVELARETIDSGAARQKLEQLRRMSNHS